MSVVGNRITYISCGNSTNIELSLVLTSPHPFLVPKANLELREQLKDKPFKAFPKYEWFRDVTKLRSHFLKTYLLYF